MAGSLDKDGWSTFTSFAPLEEVAAKFGLPVPARTGGGLVSALRVADAADGHPNSLTSRHGAGAFPYHTDGAHFALVPRYLVLRLASGTVSHRPTELVDLMGRIDDADERLLSTERWKFGTGRSCFISTIWSSGGLRYDMGIMRPAVPRRDASAGLVERLLASADPIGIDWIEGLTAVIDNHRMLHARAAGSGIPESRILERVLVMGA